MFVSFVAFVAVLPDRTKRGLDQDGRIHTYAYGKDRSIKQLALSIVIYGFGAIPLSGLLDAAQYAPMIQFTRIHGYHLA